MDDQPNLAREVNANILALEAQLTEVASHMRTADQDLVGLFCECGCMEAVMVTRADYDERGGAWREGHEPPEISS